MPVIFVVVFYLINADRLIKGKNGNMFFFFFLFRGFTLSIGRLLRAQLRSISVVLGMVADGVCPALLMEEIDVVLYSWE